MSGRLVPAHVLIDEVTGDAIGMHANGRPHNMGGAGVSVLPASTSLVLNAAGRRLHLPYTVTGATTINVSGSTPGSEVDMVVIANGTHAPTVSGASAWLSNFGYVNTNGAHNLLSCWHDGAGLRYAWSQLESITSSPPPPPAPAPDTTAPVYGTPVILNASPAKISIPITEAGTLSSTLTGSATATVAGVSRTVSSSAIVGSVVEVNLASGVVSTDAVTVSLPAGFVRDTAGNLALALTSAAVTNNVLPVGGSEDALTTAYRARAATAGITLNETHVAAADVLAKSLRAAGLHTKVTRLNLAMNDTFADSLVPFIGATADTAFNTVTFDPALGWMTNGSSCLRTDVEGTAGPFGFGAYLRTAQASDATARPLIGTSSTTDNYRIIGNRTPGVAAGSANGHVSNLQGTLVGHAGVTAGGLTVGAWHSIRRSNTNTELVRNGVSQNLNTSSTISGAVNCSQPIMVMGLNTATTPSAFLAANSRVAGYWIDDGTMTIAEMLTFYNAVQAFQTALGRQV